MRRCRIKAKLAVNEPVLCTLLHLSNASLFELASIMGFDGIWMDLEHHACSAETAEQLMRAARVGTADIVARPGKGEFMRMSRLLEAGAQGIMYPRCDDSAEAAEVVKWSKFPPIGKRGCDGSNPDMPYLSMPLDRYLNEANNQTLVIIQVEEQHAIDNAYEIAAVEGVDIVMLGPGDYSCLSGFPGQMDHPQLVKATASVADAARRAKKHWGRPASSIQEARELIDMGARFITHGADIAIVKAGFEQIQSNFQEIGFSFENQLLPKSNSTAELGGPHVLNRASQFALASEK